MQKYKIACLTYKKLDYLTKKAIANIYDDELELFTIEGIRENLVEQVNNAISEGTEVFVGGGANSKVIKQITDANLVEINVTIYDYMKALFKSAELGEKIALIFYKEKPLFDLKKFQKYLNKEISIIIYEDTEELEWKIRSSNADVIIGAALSNEIAAKLGIKSLLIYPGEQAIIKSILEAKKLAEAIRNERERSKFIQAIINYSPNGIIATDEEGIIITFNHIAQKIMGIDSNKVKGNYAKDMIGECNLDEVLKSENYSRNNIIKIKGKEILQNRIQIIDNNKIIGAVSILSPTIDIYKAKIDLYKQNNKKGFSAKSNFCNIIGNSKIIKEKIFEAKIFAQSNSSILIYGDTGVGKEIFAQSIHNYGVRSKGPFIAINCAALPENLLESELFGYEEGAFTGSKKGGKAGIFELAHDGTIFLDEIGEISPALQTRLLRVLQEKEVMRIGGESIINIDVRIISATNKNLEDCLGEVFRKDLLYRLNVLQLNIPSLKERDNDVIQLFNYFFSKKVEIDKYKIEIDKDVLKVLKYYSWPGNIRELQNVCERFWLFLNESSRDDNLFMKKILIQAIGEDKLFKDILCQHGITNTFDIDKNLITKELIDKIESIFPYTKDKIAKKIGVSRTTLWRMQNN